MNLVIVESPTKAKTIQRFLPAGFTVRSSYGHIRDLPRQKLGVDVDNNFEPQYTVTLIARKKLAEIKKLLPKTDKVILATDEDREGEAIAWHLTYALKLNINETERIVFHEITKPAIAQAIKSPRAIDMNLVNAQQARRILDRLVGYKLSPFLWRKVAKGLSAGRVQSVAVRLIVERERAIAAFKPEEYWSIEALLKKQSTINNVKLRGNHVALRNQQSTIEFLATLIKKDGKPIDKLAIKNETEAQKIVQDLTGAQYKVAILNQKEVNRYPSPPFVTSTLQQDAVNKLYFSAKQTMQIAQQLYEGITLGKEGSVGLITYMRTDSTSLAKEAVEQIRGYIKEEFGQNYLPSVARIYKTKSKGAQEAHEAIRPTDISCNPEKIKAYLTPHQYKLYKLIWRRALACQMASAILSTTAVDISAKHYLFRATGSQIKFDGFLKIYNGKTQEIILPPMTKDELLELLKLNSSQHFTQPPARFSEAALIKALEELGIGRPSTYAPTISTILDRNYVQKNPEKKFIPTDIGCQVNDLLVEHFPEIVDWQFTANMEEQLDKIAAGELAWVPVIKDFYGPFSENLTQKYQDVAKQKPEPEKTDRFCPQCQAPLLIRTSRFGKFYACSKFPACRFTENIAQEMGVGCPKCFEGQIIAKRTKRGKIFYACSRYPKCDFALWDKPTGEKCPQCGALLVAAKNGIKCNNKECDYKEKNQPAE